MMPKPRRSKEQRRLDEKQQVLGCLGVVLILFAILCLAVAGYDLYRGEEDALVRLIVWLLTLVGGGVLIFCNREGFRNWRQELGLNKQDTTTRKSDLETKDVLLLLLATAQQIEEGFRKGIPLIEQHEVWGIESKHLPCPNCDSEPMGGWIQVRNNDQEVQIRCPVCEHVFHRIKMRKSRKRS